MINVNVTPAIAAWARDYTVRAPGSVTYDDGGRVSTPTYTDRTVRAVVQPIGLARPCAR